MGLVLPVSTGLGFTLRMLFTGINIFFTSKFAVYLTFLAVLFFVVKLGIQSKIEFAHFGILASFYASKELQNRKVIIHLNKAKSALLFLAAVIMVFLNDVLNLDPNYLSFFLLTLAWLVWYSGHKSIALLIMLVTLFLYSRLFLITAVFFLAFNMLLSNGKNKLEIRHPVLTTILVYLLFFLLTAYLLFVSMEGKLPEYIELTGFDRISRLIDTSNWLRFTANFRMLAQVNPISFMLGIDGSIPFPEFPSKVIYPHNLFLSLLHNVGIVWASFYTFLLAKRSSFRADLFYSLLLYQLILGFGVFYVYVLPVLVLLNNIYEKNTVNRR